MWKKKSKEQAFRTGQPSSGCHARDAYPATRAIRWLARFSSNSSAVDCTVSPPQGPRKTSCTKANTIKVTKQQSGSSRSHDPTAHWQCRGDDTATLESWSKKRGVGGGRRRAFECSRRLGVDWLAVSCRLTCVIGCHSQVDTKIGWLTTRVKAGHVRFECARVPKRHLANVPTDLQPDELLT